MALILDGTAGITTPALSNSGNLTFTGTGNRITGLMDGGTQSNRVLFQTATANTGTTIGAIPNGTASIAQVNLYSSATPDNSSLGQIRITSTEFALNSSLLGTGTYLPMTFYTGGSERMRIDTSGNVGIGNTNPGFPLEVTSSSNSVAIRVRGRASDNIGAITFENNTGTSGSQSNYIQSTPNSNLAFGTNNTERMRIDSSGNLLVGKTTTTLTTDGVKLTAGNCNFSATSTTVVDLNRNGTDGAIFGFAKAGTIVGSVTVNGSATAYNTSSDYRLKENIQPMQNALDVVAQLNPVTYTWKADGSDGQGFIAHELQAVVPECVTGEKDGIDDNGDPKYQGVDTSFLVATLTAAIQELTARVIELEKK